jgi:uncharacterized protein
VAARRSRRWALAGFAAPALLALAAGSHSVYALDVPFLSGRVVDEAAMVPPATRERIEQKLAAFEQETGAQVAVLTVPSLQGDSLEGFSVKVAETWKLGRKGKDDGVLLLISRDDRKMRIEVGYGLEGTLTDLKSARILSDVIRPRFRAGDFGGGVEAAVDAILGTLRGNPEAIPKAPAEAVGGKPGDWAGRLFGLAVFVVVVGIHSAIALGSSGAGAWFLYFFLMIFWATFPATLISPIAGFVCWLLWAAGFPTLRFWLGRSAGGKRLVKRRPWLRNFSGTGSTWFGGGHGGGIHFGGGGGGGFSGGGGSFGGGGPSCGW